ncbi:MAG: EAL domain-containing protein [Phycisphaerales bacterium]
MSDTMIQIFGTAAVVVVIVTILETVFGRGGRSGPSIMIGVMLLAAGGLLAMADQRMVLDTVPFIHSVPDFRFARDIVGFFAGALFVGCGVFGRFATGNAREQVQRMQEASARAAAELKSVQELLSSVVRSSISGVMILQAVRDEAGIVVDFTCRLMNHEAEQILGRAATTLIGELLLKHVPCLRREGFFNDAVSVIEMKLPYMDERKCRHGDKDLWYQVAIVKHGDGVVATFADVTNRKENEGQLRRAAEHDTLTDLPSRSLLTDRLQQAINRAKRMRGYRFAVLFLDFDRFKIINDSLGHEVGDQLLISISKRLTANLRDIDTPTRLGEGDLSARLGGDEFVILLDGISGPRDAVVVAERLQTALSIPHELDGHEVISTASIGIVIVTKEGQYDRPEDILRDADTAMYQAKNSGKARHVVFDETMHNEVMQRLHLEKELREATEDLQFTLAYQPIISMQSATLIGFEALIRWPHSERGIVLPGNFIALAEELGLIVPIGKWVLREACQQLKTWQKHFSGPKPLSMSVNLSKKQLTDPTLVETLQDIIASSGISPSSLVLEITESTVMDNLDDLRPVLSRLRKEGVRLAMDDFGTGHSSLSFLHRAPMDILKIDRSFVNSSGNPRDNGAIIHTVIQLAHNFDMDVVAEGIETVEQLALLQSLDCNYGQGYLFSRPVDKEKAWAFLAKDFHFTVHANDGANIDAVDGPLDQAA